VATSDKNAPAEPTLEASTHQSKAQIDDLLKSLGLTPQSTMSEFSQALVRSGGSSPQQFGGRKGGLAGFLEGGVNAIENAPGTKNLEKLFSGISGAKPAPKAKPKGKAAVADPTSEALKAISNYLTSMTGAGEVAMGEQGQELAKQNAAVTSTVDQYLTGGGVSSGSPAVDAAQAAYAKAYSAGEGLNSAAYANMGAANAQYLASAPEQPIVNLLTQGFGSGQFKELPQSLVQNLPEAVQYALAQAGVGESAGNTATPSYGQPIPTPKGGWPKSLTGTGGSNASGSSASQLAQIIQGLTTQNNPNINTGLNQTTTPGNAAAPGA
jgi:hypothetical protein